MRRTKYSRALPPACILAALLASLPAWSQSAPSAQQAAAEERTRMLPFLGEEARKAGYELPLPFGVGLVYYKLKRDIQVTDLRIGRGGNPPVSVSQYADLGSTSDVDNVNLKLDAWLLPFLNVYAIAGKLHNESMTSVDVMLPPLRPGGSGRQFQTVVPTGIDGTVGGLGVTLAGGYKSFFGALDANVAKADLGFDNKLKATIVSARAGWNGEVDSRPLRAWVNMTYWDTFATAKGSVADPDGGTLTFEVDQGPKHKYTYGIGAMYAPRKWFEIAVDYGVDRHGGWYVAIVPVIRF